MSESNFDEDYPSSIFVPIVELREEHQTESDNVENCLKGQNRRRVKYLTDEERLEAKRRRDKEYRRRVRAAKASQTKEENFSSEVVVRDNTADVESSSHLEDNAEDSDDQVEEVDSSDEQECLNSIVQRGDSDDPEEQEQEFVNPIEGSDTRSSFNCSEQNDFIVVDPGNIDRKLDRQIGRKCKYMTNEERIESKRRRDREYRQRKRLQQECVEHNDRQLKMGRKVKYSTEEERLESKRRRDAKYRQRLRMKKLAQDLQCASDNDEQLSISTSSEQFQIKTELQCPDTATTDETRAVFVKTEYEDCRSMSAEEVTTNWDISVEVEKRNTSGRKYFTENERLLAKRRRDAEYRERLRIKKLQVEAQADLEEVAEPIVVLLSEKSSQKGIKKSPEQQEITSEDEKYKPQILIEPFSKGSENGEEPSSLIQLPSKGRKYFSQEERNKAKLRRNAEYRQRLKLKKLKEEEELDDAFSLQMSSTNEFIPKRQKYFTEEERLAAKRRRDAEYRERQRLKKLMDDAATSGTENFEQPLSTYSLSESQHSNPYKQSEQGWSNPSLKEETPSERSCRNSENGRSNSFLHNESMDSQNLNSYGHESRHSGILGSECDNFTKVIPKRPQKYFTEEERLEGKRRRDAEYRERKRLKKLMNDAVSNKADLTLDSTSHSQLSESRVSHSECEPGWDESSLKEESLEFRLGGSQSNHTFTQDDDLNKSTNSNPSRRRYNTEEERLAAKRRRDAEYRERKRLSKLNSQDLKSDSFSSNVPLSRTTSSSNHDDSNSIISENVSALIRRKYFTAEDRLAAKRRRDAEYRERQRLKKLQAEPAQELRDSDYEDLEVAPDPCDAEENVQDSDGEQMVEVAAEFSENAVQNLDCHQTDCDPKEEKLKLKRIRDAAAKRAKRLRDKLNKSSSVILSTEPKTHGMSESEKIEAKRKRDREYRCRKRSQMSSKVEEKRQLHLSSASFEVEEEEEQLIVKVEPIFQNCEES